MPDELDYEEIRVLSLVEQIFWETGKVPTNEVLSAKLGKPVAFIEKCWKRQVFRTALVARGVNLSDGADDSVLTPTQILVANMMLNTHDKRSIREKLGSVEAATGVKVTSQQYQGWMRQPAFSNYMKTRAETAFKVTDASAYTGLQKLVEANDLNAIKLFFEMRGIYNPKLQIDVNIETVVFRIVEIISRHISDPQVLSAIAEDIDSTMGGRPALNEESLDFPQQEFIEAAVVEPKTEIPKMAFTGV